VEPQSRSYSPTWRREKTKVIQALAPRTVKLCCLAKCAVCTALRSSAHREVLGAPDSEAAEIHKSNLSGFHWVHNTAAPTQREQDWDPREQGEHLGSLALRLGHHSWSHLSTLPQFPHL